MKWVFLDFEKVGGITCLRKAIKEQLSFFNDRTHILFFVLRIFYSSSNLDP